jgi:hypothetical protein
MSYDHCVLEIQIVRVCFQKAGDAQWRPTLDPYVDVVLRLLSLASVFVGFGEGVCTSKSVHVDHQCTFSLSCADGRRGLYGVKEVMRELSW